MNYYNFLLDTGSRYITLSFYGNPIGNKQGVMEFINSSGEYISITTSRIVYYTLIEQTKENIEM